MLVQNHMIVCTDRVQRTFENSTEFYEVRATNDAVWWLLQGPEYMENISSRFLRKTSDQRKLRQPKCLLFNFLKKPVGTW